MALSKIVYQDSSEELLRAVDRNGEAMTSLIEYDRGVKSASSDLVSKQLLEEYRPKDDHTACIHLIAMGNSDQYGFNRNGDYFAGDVLEKRAHTFVDNGYVFREHKNKDPQKAIGRVKWAGYDPKGMQRVELIIHIDKDKAAEEYEMAKKGSALNFSMSCRVPHDRCSICGNEAKTVKNYCNHLRFQMGQYDSGMSKYAFAYNDEPTFFEISRVKTPADRIARHLEYAFVRDEDMRKAASFGQTPPMVPSVLLAEQEGINLDVLEIPEMNLIEKMADAEEKADTLTKSAAYGDAEGYASHFIYPQALLEEMSPQELEVARSMRPENFFRQMAKRACMMSLPGFAQYITGDPGIGGARIIHLAQKKMPRVYRVMKIKVTKIIPMTSEFKAGTGIDECHECVSGDKIDNLMGSFEDKFSMQGEKVKDRVIKRTVEKKEDDDKDDGDKEKPETPEEEEKSAALAEAYAQYQVRALCDMKELMGSSFPEEQACHFLASANRSALDS